jgi:hypothetical protein
LLEADVRTGKSLRLEVGPETRSHLVLVPDAVWSDQDGELKRFPFEEIADFRRSGSELQFRHAQYALAGTGSDWQRLRFSKGKVCKEWYERICALKQAGRTRGANDPPAAQPPEVVLLRQKPNLRLQLLGPVGAEGKAGWSREAALRIRGGLLRADAIVGVENERVSGFGRTVRRASGIAVRAIEPAARTELKARWFDESVLRVTRLMLWLLAVSFVYIAAGTMLRSAQLVLLDKAMEELGFGKLWVAGICAVAVAYAWPVLLTLLLRGFRWPQLIPATAITFLTHFILMWAWTGFPGVPRTGDDFVYVALGVALVLSGSRWPRPVAAVAWTLLILRCVLFSGVDLLVFGGFVALGCRLAIRIWRTHQRLRETSGDTVGHLPPARNWVGRLSVTVSLVVAILFVGLAVYPHLEPFRPSGVNTPVSLAKRGSAASLGGIEYSSVTNDLPDIGVSWLLNSGWQENQTISMPGLLHSFTFKGQIIATANVQDTQALPPSMQGGQEQVLQSKQELFFRDLVHPERLRGPQPVQNDGTSWLETELKGAYPAAPNLDFRFLLRTHADPTRQVMVVVGCPGVLWDQLKEQAKAAADGFHLRSRPSGRRLEPPVAGTPLNNYKGVMQPYLCRLSSSWRPQAVPSSVDILFARGTNMVFCVSLEDASKQVPSLQQAEAMLLNGLEKKLSGFQFIGSEDVVVGERRARLLRFRYRINQFDITEDRVLVVHSGWLYHLRAWTSDPNADLPVLEEALAGIQFPSGIAR